MKFGDYELICPGCQGKHFDKKVDVVTKKIIADNTNGKSAWENKVELGWNLMFSCRGCLERRAFISLKEPSILHVRQMGESVIVNSRKTLDKRRAPPDLLIKITDRDARDAICHIKHAANTIRAAARVHVMRHGYSRSHVAFASKNGLSSRAAKMFLDKARRQMLAEEAATVGKTELELEKNRREEAMRFYRSIVADPDAWERDPKMVLQARKELSILEGIAAEVSPVNVNIDNSTGPKQQITVYQLAVPDNGRARLPAPEEPLVIEHAGEQAECLPSPPPSPKPE